MKVSVDDPGFLPVTLRLESEGEFKAFMDMLYAVKDMRNLSVVTAEQARVVIDAIEEAVE